jgi:hypothetical protein
MVATDRSATEAHRTDPAGALHRCRLPIVGPSAVITITIHVLEVVVVVVVVLLYLLIKLWRRI